MELDRLKVEVSPPRLNRFLVMVDSLLGDEDRKGI